MMDFGVVREGFKCCFVFVDVFKFFVECIVEGNVFWWICCKWLDFCF